jgi:hypothetical protein
MTIRRWYILIRLLHGDDYCYGPMGVHLTGVYLMGIYFMVMHLISVKVEVESGQL